MEKINKPIYKKTWFIILVSIIAIAIIGSLADNEEKPTVGSGDETESQASSQNSKSEADTSILKETTSESEQEQEIEVTEKLDKKTIDPKSLDWNAKDLDPFTNGNIDRALDMLLSMTADEINNLTYSDVDIKDVIKTPWNYYGQKIKITGYVELIEAHPPGGEVSNALAGGNEFVELVILSDDEITYTNYFLIGTTNISVGDYVEAYGFPVGRTEVDNMMGGKTSTLVVMGK